MEQPISAQERLQRAKERMRLSATGTETPLRASTPVTNSIVEPGLPDTEVVDVAPQPAETEATPVSPYDRLRRAEQRMGVVRQSLNEGATEDGVTIEVTPEQIGEEAKVTFEGLINDKNLVQSIRRYAANIENELFAEGEEGDAEAIDWYIADRRWKDSNVASAFSQGLDVMGASEQDLQDLDYMMRTWDQLPAFWQEGGQGWRGLWANLWRGFADPVSIGVSILTGGAGGAIGGRLAGRAAGATAASAAKGRLIGGIAGGVAGDTMSAGAADVAVQAARMETGTQEEYSPTQTAISAGVGGLASAAISGTAGALVGSFQNARGTNVVRNASRDLVLDGIDYADRTVVPEPEGRSNTLTATVEGRRIFEIEGMEIQAATPEDALKRYNTYFASNPVDLVNVREKSFESTGEIRSMFDLMGVQKGQIFRDGQIVEGAENQSLMSRLKASFSRKMRNTQQELLDYTEGFSRVDRLRERYGTGQPVAAISRLIPMSQNKFITAQLALADGGAQFRFTSDGLVKIDGSNGYAATFSAIRELPVDKGTTALKYAADYMLFNRLLRAEGAIPDPYRQKLIANTGIDIDQATRFVDFIDNEFAAAEPQVYAAMKDFMAKHEAYNANHMQFMVDSGLVSSQSAADMLLVESMYLPTNRLADKNGDLTGAFSNTIKAMEGLNPNAPRDSQFIDPIASYARAVDAQIVQGIENIKTRATVNAVNELPPGLRAMIIETPENNARPSVLSFDRIFDAMKKEGVTDAEIQQIKTVIQNNPAVGDSLTLWMSRRMPPGKDGVNGWSSYMDGGELKFVRIKDQNLAESMAQFGNRHMDELAESPIMRGLQAHVQALQAFITRDPEFLLGTSLFTDTFAPFILQSDPSKGLVGNVLDWRNLPFVNMGKGAREQFVRQFTTDNRILVEGIANGALMSGPVASHQIPVVTSWFKKMGIATDNILGLTDAQDVSIGRALAQRTSQSMQNAWGAYDRYFASALENIPRLTQYMRNTEMGMSPLDAASKAARENINFRNYGVNKGFNTYSSLIPFFSAIRNVNYTFLRTLDLSKPQNRAAQAKMVMGMTVPIIGLYMLNKDQEWYQEITPEERRLFWHFNVGTDEDLYIVKIRKDETFGIYGNAIEQAMTLMEEEGMDMDDAVFQTIFETINSATGGFRGESGMQTISNLMPLAMGHLLEQLMNQGFAGAIVPSYLQNPLNPSEEYRPGQTSDLVRDVAGAMPFEASPLRVEYAMRQLLGPLAKYAIDVSKITDDAVASRMSLEEFPVFRRFLSNPDRPRSVTADSERFYAIKEEIDAIMDVENSNEKWMRVDSMQNFYDDLSSDEKMRTMYILSDTFNAAKNQVDEYRNLIRVLDALPPATEDEAVQKEEQRRQLQAAINETMRITMDVYRSVVKPSADEQTEEAFSE